MMSPMIITVLREFLEAAKDNPRQEHHFLREFERVDRYQSLAKYLLEWKLERSRRIRVQHTWRQLLGSQYDL